MTDQARPLDPDQLLSAARAIQQDLDVEAVEILARTSRARVVTFEFARSGALSIESQGSQEAGHTVRFAGSDAWGVWSATGSPRSPEQVPAAAPGRLALPDPRRVRSLRNPGALSDSSTRSRVLERPLLGESDAKRWIDRLLQSITSMLEDRERPSAGLVLRGRLEDGAAESLLVNSHGVVAPERSRVTGVRLEMSLGPRSASVYLAASDDLPSGSTEALRGLFAELDLLHAAEDLASSDETDLVLRPAVLAPLLARIGGRCWRPTQSPAEMRMNRSSGASLWDCPDRATGFLGGERDGEGLYAQRRLIADDRGLFSLKPWEHLSQVERGEEDAESPARGDASSNETGLGFRWRASWRELPRFGPSHLVLQVKEPVPDPLDATGNGFEAVVMQDLETDDRGLAVTVRGYRIERGARGEPLRAVLRLSEAQILSRLTGCSGAEETHTLPICTVSCPTGLFDSLCLEPLRRPA